MKKEKLEKRIYSTGNPELDKLVGELVEKAPAIRNNELIREIIVTALRLDEDDMERGDIKMINASMKELRYALKVFYPYRHIRKVALFGSARTPPTSPDYKQARDFAKAIAAKGWMVITGASSGIMCAGNEGAGRSKSFGVNIRLPFEQSANENIIDDPKLINFKYFFTRKLIFIRESDATVLCPGGFGTHDEGFETLTLIQTGKTSPRPVIALDPPNSTYWKGWKSFVVNQLAKKKFIDPEDMALIDFTHSAKEAAEIVERFYLNYHSSRYIADRLVFRLKKPLLPAQMDRINDKFASILKKGKFEQFEHPFSEEENEPHTFDLTRLAFYFNRRHFAGLRRLINSVNEM